jgi:hypothetical protein
VINKTARYREYFSRTSDRKETIISGYIRHHLSIYKLVVHTFAPCATTFD